MLGNIIKRLKGNFSNVANSALAANEETVMEAMVASMVLVAYADDICSNEEVDKVNDLIASNPQLREFRNEPVRLFDNYCDQMEASPMMARIDLMKKITKVLGDETNAPRVLISAIEVAYSSVEEGEDNISEKEEDTLADIAKALDLKLGKFI